VIEVTAAAASAFERLVEGVVKALADGP